MTGDARTFLEALWPLDVAEGEVVSVSAQRPGETVETAPASSLDELLRYVENGNRAGAHVWLNVASRKPGTSSRGGLSDCVTVPALWADLDVAAPGHTDVHKGATFDTWADVLTFVDSFPLPPTFLVRTGWGGSAWWVLDEPVSAEVAGPLIDALKATVLRRSDGRADASVYEVARMMRLPGTVNVKVAGDPRPVTIERHSPAARYSPDDLADALDLPAPQVAASASAGVASGVGRPGDDYAAQMTTEETVALLKAAGCEEVGRHVAEGRTIVKLARPGKGTRNGPSMTVGWVGEAIVHLFSDGWKDNGVHVVPPGTWTPFALRALLRHHGDYGACARELAALGFGGSEVEPLEALPELDGASVAEDFVRTMAGGALYVGGVGWLLWDTTRYVVDSEGRGVMRHVLRYVRRMVARARIDAHGADTETDEGKQAVAALKRCRGYLERAPRTRLVEDAADELAADANDLDAWPELLNCANGVVDLRTGLLRPHDPALRMTKITAAAYAPGASSPDWAKALDALSPDLCGYLQVALGLSCVGRSQADLVMIAVGSGGNGKGTILGAAVHAIGDYSHTVPAKLFTDQATRETQLLMPLRGARIAMAAETGEDHMLNMERLKALSGGDPITDRFLYSRSFATWDPTHTLWLQTNARPKVRNTDEGTWRRLQLVPFAASYQRGADGRDDLLRDRLRLEAVNRAAVLAWLVEGARRWLTTGTLPACAEVESASAAWRDEEDTIAMALDDLAMEVTGDPGHSIPAGDLYTAYRLKASDNGQRPFSVQSFKREMERYAERLRIARRPTFYVAKRRSSLVWVGLRRLSVIITDELETPRWVPEAPEEGNGRSTDPTTDSEMPW